MSSINPRKNNNNWRVAAVLMSYDIRKDGFRRGMRSTLVRTLDDAQLVDLIDEEPARTGLRIADNILGGLVAARPRTEGSDKLWRGDIEDCYARLMNNIDCAMHMAKVEDPGLFGWDHDDWKETAAGLKPFPNYQECRILLECFEARNEREQAYLYNRIKYVLDPKPVMGINSIPIPCFNFTR